MSVGSVMVALQASRRDGANVSAEMFLEPLAIRAGEAVACRADRGPWASGLVVLGLVQRADFDRIEAVEDAGAPSAAFDAAVAAGLHDAARFLSVRSIAVIESMRRAGLSVRMFIEFRMDDDQMEFELPCELVAACARHRLGICVISNDISAADLA